MGMWDDFFTKAKSLFSGGEEKKARCYYEMLGVSKNATEDEIKRAYKKMALKWHPDKNPDRLEECTAYFVILQQAYEVLSDPHERAFYDRHRENIIHGGDAGPNEKKDTGIVLSPYFERSCFSGFGDDDAGFYAVYRDLFHKISAEEYLYIEDMEDRNFPVFGNSKSTYEMIVDPFYSFWMGFSTHRSFAWLDKYNLRQAEDRQTLRLMEKENRKLREQGRSERSEEIQRLVAYVRKLDPRVKAYRAQLAERNREHQKQVDSHRLQMIRRNLEELDDYEIDEAMHREHMRRLEEIDAELDAQFGQLSTKRPGNESANSDVDDDDENTYCVVCEKNFKSAKSYSNHIKSKKHRQNVEQVRKHMREEDRAILEELDREQNDVAPPPAKSKCQKGAANEAEDVEEEDKPVEVTSMDQPANSEDVPQLQRDQPVEEPKNGQNKEKSKTKKKARRAQPNAKNMPEAQPAKGPTVPVACNCEMCGEEFESRTKLFTHLRDSGHAILKDVNRTIAASNAGKKAGNRK